MAGKEQETLKTLGLADMSYLQGLQAGLPEAIPKDPSWVASSLKHSLSNHRTQDIPAEASHTLTLSCRKRLNRGGSQLPKGGPEIEHPPLAGACHSSLDVFVYVF